MYAILQCASHALFIELLQCIFNEYRLSGIIHVLFKAMNICLKEDVDDSLFENSPHSPTPVTEDIDDGRTMPQASTPTKSDSPPYVSPVESPILQAQERVLLETDHEIAAVSDTRPKFIIKEKTARMAVALAEYFQQQLAVCEKVTV